MTDTPKEPRGTQARGFALLPAARKSAIASMGGAASQRSGHGRQWTRAQAKEAARMSAAVRTAPVWMSSDGVLILRVILADALPCAMPGQVDHKVRELSQRPYIARQLATVSPQAARAALRPFGVWSEYELRDHSANLLRLLWIACGDIQERYRG